MENSKINEKYNKWILVFLRNNNKIKKIFLTKDVKYMNYRILDYFGGKAKSYLSDGKITTFYQNDDYNFIQINGEEIEKGKSAEIIDEAFIGYVLYGFLDEGECGLTKNTKMRKEMLKSINEIGKKELKELILNDYVETIKIL